MDSQFILDRIQTNYPLFSTKERKLADFFLKHREESANKNIGDLAEITGTSPSTITRFCKKLGCQSYIEFKVLLNNRISDNQAHQDVMNRVKAYYLETIDSTAMMISLEKLNQVVQFIHTAKKIRIYGVGNSGLSAMEFKYRLMRMGFTVDAMTDSHMMLMNAALCQENDLIIAISNSGMTKEITEAAGEAKSRGAHVIAITNHDHTPLTDVSDMILLTSNTQHLRDAHFVNNQLAIVYVIDLISMQLLEESRLEQKRKETVEVLVKHKKI